MDLPSFQEPFPDELLVSRGLQWRKWPLTHFAVPFALSSRQRALLHEAVPALHRGALAVVRAFREDPSLRRLFGYGALHESFILQEPGYSPEIPLGRLDSYLYPDAVKFLEYNTDGTAGWHYAAALAALWRERAGLPPERAPLGRRLFETLLACYRQWSGGEPPARMALVDWADVGTAPEQRALARAFTGWGVPCTLEDPSRLRFTAGRLVGEAGPLDLVYRRVVSEEVFAEPGRARGFLDACRASAFGCVGGFCTDPAWSKLLFVVLSDPAWGHLFGEADRRIFARTVPWTRLVGGGGTSYEGRAWGFESLLLSDRGRFLLKPAFGYQGEGVVAGPQVSGEAWRTAVLRALQGGWVAQEYLAPVPWEHPWTKERYYVQVGEFVLIGRWAGLMVRVCARPVITLDAVDLFLPAADEILGQEMP